MLQAHKRGALHEILWLKINVDKYITDTTEFSAGSFQSKLLQKQNPILQFWLVAIIFS